MLAKFQFASAFLPFIVRGILFDEKRAVKFARLAGAVYCGNEKRDLVEAWNCGTKCLAEVTNVKMCAGSTTVSIVGIWEGGCVVSFEGTQTTASFVQDALSALPVEYNCSGSKTTCRVGDGFLREWKSHANCVKANLDAHGCKPGSNKPVKMTGHSLGASVNLLAMVELTNLGYEVGESYHFGTPRTGDEAFAQYFNSIFGKKHWRVTHAYDPVPQVPPRDLGWTHVEPEGYYRGTLMDGRQECSDPNNASECSLVHGGINVIDDVIHHARDHLMYMDVDLDNGVAHGCSFGAEGFQILV